MKTAQSILEAKGYESFECIEIINDFDMKVREKYNLEDEPLHLWESYYIGDADEDTILEVAKNNECDEIGDLLDLMDRKLFDLAYQYPDKD